MFKLLALKVEKFAPFGPHILLYDVTHPRLFLSLFCVYGSMGFPQRIYGLLWQKGALIYYLLLTFEYQTQFERDYVSRHGHIIKTTHLNLTIVVSFFSPCVLSNEIKACDIFGCQSSKNRPFLFWGDTQ